MWILDQKREKKPSFHALSVKSGESQRAFLSLRLLLLQAGSSSSSLCLNQSCIPVIFHELSTHREVRNEATLHLVSADDVARIEPPGVHRREHRRRRGRRVPRGHHPTGSGNSFLISQVMEILALAAVEAKDSSNNQPSSTPDEFPEI